MEIYYDRIYEKIAELKSLVGKTAEEIATYLEYDYFSDFKDELPDKFYEEENYGVYMFYNKEGSQILTEEGLLELIMTSNQYKALEFQNLIRPVIRKAKEDNIEL